MQNGGQRERQDTEHLCIINVVKNTVTMEIGPSLPPHLLQKGKHSLTDSEDTEIVPSLPPHLLSKKTKCEQSFQGDEDDSIYGPALPPQKKKRNAPIGPALPEDDQNFKHGQYDKEDENDQDIGPMIGPMPSACSLDAYKQNIEKDIETRSNSMKDMLLGKNVVKQKREEWMTELPLEMNKNFGLGPRTFRHKAVDCGDRSVWTDTPADKAKKMNSRKGLEDETVHKTPWEEERERHMEEMIQDYNEKNRGESLLEKHQKKIKKQKKEEDTKPNERRPFDRDKDLANPTLDPSKRKSIIDESRKLGSRFHHSKSGSSYL